MLVLKIATRYLLALRKASTVQVLSLLSFLGILFGTMAMVIVLSAFNGFEDLLKSVYHFQDPDLRIEAAKGKYFEIPTEKRNEIQKIKGMKGTFEVLADKASLQYGDGQMVVEIIGIEPDFVKVSRLDTSVKTGVFELQGKEGLRALVSIGIQQSLNISLQNVFESIKLAYPKRTKIWKTATGKIFNTRSLPVAGIVQMDENRVYLPLSLARELMEKPKGMNYLDVYLTDENSESDKIKAELEAVLGPGFVVKNETEQHSDLYKIMRIEKLFVFLALGFIILISTFNLFVSSTMLVLDKTRDLKILSAMGFSPQKSAVLIRLTGLIISFFGLNLGLFFGIGLCLLQKQFGFIPLGMASTMIRDYPVSVHLGDLFLIGLWVMISSYLAMIIPSKRARTITEMSSVG